MLDEPRIATRDDFAQIISSLSDFWGQRDVGHLHHPTAIEEFGDSALVIQDQDGRVAAYLFGMIVAHKRVGYVHVVAVRHDYRGRGLGRKLYEALTELATARGCTISKAITTASNTDSIAFHESIGMRSHEEPDYSGPGQARVVFTRALRTATLPTPPIDGLELRAATREDVDQLLEFWRVAAEDSDRPTDRREAIEGLIARDPDALLLATLADKMVACVIIGWDGWRAHLYRLAVHPEYRRHGLARWLLEVAEQRLRTTTAIRIDAMVLDSNEPAHIVWSKAGYSRQPHWSRWVAPLTT
jgi:ribosomal protein S18 acetylase RimI-like enzyme